MDQAKFNQTFASHVGVCHWAKRAIQGEGTCYKHAFYGIPSHQCLELAIAPNACNLDCAYCWRNLEKPKKSGLRLVEVPGYIDKLIALRAQKISGFGNQEGLDPSVREESLNPRFWTISYSGEPALSPDLPRLVADLKGRGIKVLVVTNGTRPEGIDALAANPPDQLYLSLCGYDEASFGIISNPKEKGLWQKVGLSIQALKRIQCRLAFRITLIREFNLGAMGQFAPLIGEGRPEFVELKAYAHMGQSIHRMLFSSAPPFRMVQEAARELAQKTGYLVAAEQERGGAVLLCRDKECEQARFFV